MARLQKKQKPRTTFEQDLLDAARDMLAHISGEKQFITYTQLREKVTLK